MTKKKPVHLTVDGGLDELLGAIATAMEDELRPRPTKSDLVGKAIELYVNACRQRPDLQGAIAAVEARLAAAEKVVPLAAGGRVKANKAVKPQQAS